MRCARKWQARHGDKIAFHLESCLVRGLEPVCAYTHTHKHKVRYTHTNKSQIGDVNETERWWLRPERGGAESVTARRDEEDKKLRSHSGRCSQSIPTDVGDTTSLAYSSTLSLLYSPFPFSTSRFILLCQHKASPVYLPSLKTLLLSWFNHRLPTRPYSVCFNHPRAFLLWWSSTNSRIVKTIYLHDQHQLGAEAVDQTESTLELLDWWEGAGFGWGEKTVWRARDTGGGVSVSLSATDSMWDDISTSH